MFVVTSIDGKSAATLVRRDRTLARADGAPLFPCAVRCK
jgi:hypothetical protein